MNPPSGPKDGLQKMFSAASAENFNISSLDLRELSGVRSIFDWFRNSDGFPKQVPFFWFVWQTRKERLEKSSLPANIWKSVAGSVTFFVSAMPGKIHWCGFVKGSKKRCLERDTLICEGSFRKNVEWQRKKNWNGSFQKQNRSLSLFLTSDNFYDFRPVFTFLGQLIPFVFYE